MGQYLLQRSERRQLARCVARGLAGEIDALLHIVECRQSLSEIKKAAQSADPQPLSVSVSQNYSRMFDANVDKLGLLDGDLPGKVADFYVQGSALIEDFRTISHPGLALLAAGVRQELFAQMADLLEETVALRKAAADKLRCCTG